MNKQTKLSSSPIQILLANPRGFCAGVDRAIIIVEEALRQFGAPIYVRHEVVHNKFVVDALREQGAVFVENLEEVPTGSTVIFSAHGVSKDVRKEADKLGLRVFDATCPLVTKVHLEVAKMHEAGYEIMMIGHRGHPEVEGTMGQIASGIYLIETLEDIHRLEVKNPNKVAYVTQTTLSVDDAAHLVKALTEKFPDIRAPRSDSICYATQNRQDAIKTLSSQTDLVIVVGSPNSSNSNRLQEVAQKHGVESYMVDNASYIDPTWLEGKQSIGVSAGASAPEVLVQEVISELQKKTTAQVRELEGVTEHVVFQLPKALQKE
jgi:4-hydroxy-3-methylbut-2-en-1-yl diphosphate reductase